MAGGVNEKCGLAAVQRLGNGFKGAGIGLHDRQVVTGFRGVAAWVEEQAADADVFEVGDRRLERFAFPEHPLRGVGLQLFLEVVPRVAVGSLVGLPMDLDTVELVAANEVLVDGV